MRMLLALTIAVGSNSLAQSQRFDGVTLQVGTFGGAWKDALQELVGTELEKLGAKVEYITGPPKANLAKLLVANGRDIPFDIAEFDQTTVPKALAAHLLQPFDLAQIPNAAGLIEPPSEGNRLVPVWAFEEGVVFNATKFKELGIPKPQRYSDLANPKLKGRVGFADLSGYDGALTVYGFAVDAGGGVDNIAPGLEVMKRLGANRYFVSAPDAAAALTSGDLWANFMAAPWAIRLRKGGHDWVDFAHLKLGGNVGLWTTGYMGLVKGSKNSNAAAYFLNLYLSDRVQKELTLRMGSLTVKTAVLNDLGKDAIVSQFTKLSPADISNMRKVDFSRIDLNNWSDEWNRVMTE